ncbi:cytochrome P450 [Mycena crocata]|nr:cytochrome P450 [Mycena crocata]
MSGLFLSLAGTLGAYALYQILGAVLRQLNSPLRHVPGPKSKHFLAWFREPWHAESYDVHEQWVQQYGSILKYKGSFGITRLYATDTKALNHFLTNTQIYHKPEHNRYVLSRVVGPGVLVTEGEVHRQQRKIMNPAFGAPQLRELTGIFVEKSIELRDIWATQVDNQNGTARVDVLKDFGKATLDIIGQAGFNYHFNSLSSETESELGKAFATVLYAAAPMTYLRILQGLSPIFRLIPTRVDGIIRTSQETMLRIGRQLLADSKREMAENGTFEKGRARDLLSLLVRANTAKDIPSSQRLSDEDVLAQVPTFLFAGHETTSTGTTWALYALTQNTAAQTRLRDELLAVPTDNPTMDELNALPYLDCVVRETLRLHAPVPGTSRVAMQDDVVPLASPFTDVKGIVHDSIRVKKGQMITIPILGMNRAKDIWGADADKFRPERWEVQPPISNSMPGIWGQMLSFLAGPRACIGYRFSLIEMKALLFTLIRALEFELAVPVADVGMKTYIVQRPILRSQPEGGNQMPLLVKRYIR